MMNSIALSLKATVREETGKKVTNLRQQGKIPAVLYGHKVKPVNLTVDYTAFDKLYQAAGDSTLVDLIINDNQPVKVLIQDYQADPVSSLFTHVDLYQVNMKEKIHADITLKFVNEAPAVKELGGVLIKNLAFLDVECLPSDLVHEISVDLSSIKTFEDIIHVKDLQIPAGLTVKNKLDDVVAQVQVQVEEEIPIEAPVTAVPAEAVAGKEATEDKGATAETVVGKVEGKPEGKKEPSKKE